METPENLSDVFAELNGNAANVIVSKAEEETITEANG